MATTSNDSTGGTSGDGGSMSQALAFLKEPLGMGIALGLSIALALGYLIL